MNEDHINRKLYSVLGGWGAIISLTPLSCCCNLCIENRMGYNFRNKVVCSIIQKNKQTNKTPSVVFTPKDRVTGISTGE